MAEEKNKKEQVVDKPIVPDAKVIGTMVYQPVYSFHDTESNVKCYSNHSRMSCVKL